MSATRRVIRFQRPELPPLEQIDRYFAESRRTRWFSNGGPCHRRLVERCSVSLGASAVPVASGTTGLMLAIRAVTDVSDPSRREILMPSFTFAATAAAAVWAGFEPVLVDVEPEGWHLDPDRLRAALEDRAGRVGAVIACSTFGTAPPIAQRERWEADCAAAGVPLVVDSAAGFGSRDEADRPLGAQGAAEVFSFHATKPLAIGEGGLVATTDPDLAERVARLSNFGFDAEQSLAECGLNGKLDEWHCAVALAALDRLPEVLEARRARAAAMLEQLADLGLERQAGGERAAWQFVPMLARDGRERDAVLAAARESGVEVRTYFDPPLHRSRPFQAHRRADTLAVTEDLAGRCLSLPMANDLDDEEVSRIVAAIRLGCAA